MMLDDTYKIVAGRGQSLYKEKGSRFIGFAFPIFSEESFKEELAQIRKDYFDARHHCYAFMLLPDKSIFRSSDDGEPSGTAGKPMLNQILSLDLTNTGIVVVRYFGGIKLGVSGLITAYKTASREALDAAGCITKTINVLYELHFTYPLMNEVMRVLKEENIEMIQPDFTLDCKLKINVRKKEAARIEEKLKSIYGLKLVQNVTI